MQSEIHALPFVSTSPFPHASVTDNRLVYPALARFAHRKSVLVAIVLTPEQARDAKLRDLAAGLAKYYRSQGRQVVATTELRQAVRGLQPLQPLQPIQPYPQWQTIKADLVLLGNSQNNPLLFDQARGYLLPGKIDSPNIQITYSPFAGECQVVNVLANDNEGLAAGMEQIVLAGQPPHLRALIDTKPATGPGL